MYQQLQQYLVITITFTLITHTTRCSDNTKTRLTFTNYTQYRNQVMNEGLSDIRKKYGLDKDDIFDYGLPHNYQQSKLTTEQKQEETYGYILSLIHFNELPSPLEFTARIVNQCRKSPALMVALINPQIEPKKFSILAFGKELTKICTEKKITILEDSNMQQRFKKAFFNILAKDVTPIEKLLTHPDKNEIQKYLLPNPVTETTKQLSCDEKTQSQQTQCIIFTHIPLLKNTDPKVLIDTVNNPAMAIIGTTEYSFFIQNEHIVQSIKTVDRHNHFLVYAYHAQEEVVIRIGNYIYTYKLPDENEKEYWYIASYFINIHATCLRYFRSSIKKDDEKINTIKTAYNETVDIVKALVTQHSISLQKYTDFLKLIPDSEIIKKNNSLISRFKTHMRQLCTGTHAKLTLINGLLWYTKNAGFIPNIPIISGYRLFTFLRVTWAWRALSGVVSDCSVNYPIFYNILQRSKFLFALSTLITVPQICTDLLSFLLQLKQAYRLNLPLKANLIILNRTLA